MNARMETLIEQARGLSAKEQRRLATYDRGEVAAGDFDVLLDRLRQKYVFGAAMPLTKISNH
jgi:hypothetical protein